MSIIGTIYEDVTTDVLGKIGIWQWMVVIISTALMMPSMFNQYEDMFLLKSPEEVICIPPERQDILNASLCTVTFASNASELECSKWHIKLFWFIRLKKTWLVFCDNKMKLLSTTMISRMGLMFGCVMFGLIADSFGRKKAIMIDLFAQLGLGLTVTFCDSQAWFQLLVFLKGLFGGATVYMGLILTCEVASNGWRSRLSAIVCVPHLLSITCLIPLANSFPNLETYDFMSTMFVILLIIILRWTPESPQWLLFNRKIPLAEKTLLHAAKTNAKHLCDEFKIRPVNHRAYNCLDETRPCAEIFTTYNTKIIIIVFLIFWVLLGFQRSYLYIKVFENKSDQYFFVLICSTVTFTCLTIILSTKLLIRHLFLFNILISGISATSEILFGQITQIFPAVALGSEVVVYLLLLNITPRLFAINVRATLFGCCHALGQLGTMLSYLLFQFQPLSDIACVTVNVSVTLVLITLCLVLHDVDERELPDMIEDMDYFSELSKPLRWATQKTNNPSQEEVEMRIHSFGSTGRELSNNRSQERMPAQPIGFIKFWRMLINMFQNLF